MVQWYKSVPTAFPPLHLDLVYLMLLMCKETEMSVVTTLCLPQHTSTTYSPRGEWASPGC